MPLLAKIEYQHYYPDENPAPNQYDVKHSSLSSLRRPPSCKLGQRLTSPGSEHISGPGPAAYYTRQDSTRCGGVITPRRPPQKGTYTNHAPLVFLACAGIAGDTCMLSHITIE